MLLLEDFESKKDAWGYAWDSADCSRVNQSYCLLCCRGLIYYGWKNPKTGRGFAVCNRCKVVEELWIDRDGELAAAAT